MNQFISKALLVSATLGLASASLADTTIYITGSTAFRQQVYNALTSTTINGNPLFIKSSVNSSGIGFNGAKNQFIAQGYTTANGTNDLITVSCAFSGSVEGIVAVVGGGAMQPNNAVLNDFLTAYNNATTIPAASVNGGNGADLAFSDVSQNTTLYSAAAGYNDLTYPNSEFVDTTHKGVGVIPFGWAASAPLTAAAGFSGNVSHQVAQTILGAGSIELKAFTGNASDTAAVYLTGRYSLSGTRLVTQADTGFGANQGSTLYTVSGLGTMANPYVPSDLSTVWATNSISYSNPMNIGADPVNGGYNSGGSVVKLLDTVTGANNYFIGYAGWPDMVTHVTPLTYDGVALTKTNIINGSYSMWSYEHLYANTATISDVTDPTDDKVLFLLGNSNADPFKSNGFLAYLNAEIGNNANVVQISAMKATRAADGGRITPQ